MITQRFSVELSGSIWEVSTGEIQMKVCSEGWKCYLVRALQYLVLKEGVTRQRIVSHTSAVQKLYGGLRFFL